jgi:hypothetical protein
MVSVGPYGVLITSCFLLTNLNYKETDRGPFTLKAILMKRLSTILLISLCNPALGQAPIDTCITRTLFTEYKQKLYQLKDQNEIFFFRMLLFTQLKQIDTILQTKDSIVLNYVRDTNTTLKKEKQIFRRSCMTDSIVTHFNVNGQIVYSEWWTITCDNPDAIDNKLVIYKYKGRYDRYEYDRENRVTKYVVHLSTPYTRRILISYDSKGNKTQTVANINEYDFWD